MSNGRISLLSSDAPSLLGIIYKLSDWLISLLQLYFVINIAIVGWILTTKPVWEISQKIIFAFIYLLAVLINLLWFYRLYGWLMNVVNEFSNTVEKIEFASFEENIKPIIDGVSKANWWWMLFIFHVCSDIAVVGCIVALTSNK